MSTHSHNYLAPKIVKEMVKGSDSESDCMVLLESIILGIMLFYCPNPRHAAEYLDSMTAAVIERMKP